MAALEALVIREAFPYAPTARPPRHRMLRARNQFCAANFRAR